LKITVSNHATGEIALTGADIGAANAGDFSVTGGTCAGTVAATSSCTYAVTFTPRAETTEGRHAFDRYRGSSQWRSIKK
jgi:hypothetical protein